MKIHDLLRSRGRRAGAVLGVATLLVATSACGASEADPQGADEKLKLAFFSVGSNNSYLQAGIDGARDAAKRYNADIEVFDGAFDGAKQLNQVTQAISRGFDGFVIEPNNSTQLCSAVNAALNANIEVGITNVPACDAAYDSVYEGTTIFVGGQSPEVYKQWFEQGLSDPAGGEFAVLNGPATHGNTVRARTVLDDVKAKHPAWKEVGFAYTDYEASKALSETQTLLQQHPNLKAIFSSYAGHTPGIISAIKAAGKTGEVKVYDLGGDQAMFAALEKGEITSTLVYLPYEEQYRAVQSVVAKLRGQDELDGVKVGEFWDLTTDPKLEGLPAFVEKANIDKYTSIGLPEY
jgi:ribose transport system substrate-binding protein